jgi:hypothetical protein
LCGFVLACSLSLSGCGETAAEPVETVSGNTVILPDSMESIAVLDYSIPYQQPGSVVDRSGYSATGNKIAYVVGETLPARFSVVDDRTGMTVFEGDLDIVSLAGEVVHGISVADFGSLQTPGTYHLECRKVGHSYSFEIREGYYQSRYEEILAQMKPRLEDSAESASNVMYLLQSCEWNAQIVPDGDGDKIPDELYAVGLWIAGIDYDNIPEEQVNEYVAVLAKFSYLYRNYNVKLATECLQKAASLYQQSKNVLGSDDDSFRALTELYRASGQYSYRTEIEDYASYFSNHTGYMDQEGYLYGAMTYMVTRQKVDTTLCTTFMNDMLGTAEEVGNRKKEMLTPGLARNNGEADLLLSAQQLICANYVLEGVQYNDMLEEILHYLSGCNTASVPFEITEENSGRYLLLYGWLDRLEQSGMIMER